MIFEIPWPGKKGKKSSVAESAQSKNIEKESERLEDRIAALLEKNGVGSDIEGQAPIIEGDAKVLDYSSEEKKGFLSGWSDDLSTLANSIENRSAGHVFNTLREEDAELIVEWDESGDVRLVWICTIGEDGASVRERITDLTQIVDAFPLAVMETVYDKAKDALEYQKKRELL